MMCTKKAELLEIYHQARSLIDQPSNPFRPLTKQQILADLAASRKQIKEGEYLDFEDAINEIEDLLFIPPTADHFC